MNEVNLNRMLLLLAVCAALFAAGVARAEWTDHSDPLEPVVEDDPAWDKYAFELPYANDEGKLSFHELARSGEPFVLYFWLTDCPMCHLQMPFVQQLHNQSKERKLDLRVVSICIDSDTRDCLPYIEDKKVKFDVLLDGHARRTDEQYQVRENGTPLAFVFKGRGVLAGKISGYTNDFSADVLRLLGIDPEGPNSPDAGD